MCDVNIEHAGVHYASHALMEVQRELQRELAREEGTHALIKKAESQSDSRRSAALVKRSSADTAVSANAAADGALVAAANGELVEAEGSSEWAHPSKATDLLDQFGAHPPGDYAARQLEVPPPVPLAVLRETVDTVPEHDMLVTAASGRKDVHQMLMQNTEGELVPVEDEAAPEMDEDEAAAMEFVQRHPRYRGEFMEILNQLREQRRSREHLESLEDITRNAIGDAWSLQWEDLYEFCLAARKRAAEDMRARLSRAHWHERLLTRQREMEAAREERSKEEIFHTDGILAELEMKRYLEWWNEQLASFKLSMLLITGPEGTPQLSVEDKPAASAPAAN